MQQKIKTMKHARDTVSDAILQDGQFSHKELTDEKDEH
jgi:hypothetical protein